MKKYFLLMALPLALCLTACGDDEDSPAYSKQQQKVQAMFNGTFADYQFSNLGNSELSHLLGDPDLIVFTQAYSKPVELRVEDYLNGSKYLGDAHGECVYKTKYMKDEPYESVECYYYIGVKGTNLTLYQKSDKSVYRTYTMNVVSSTEFHLHQSGITLPFIFKKQ